MNNGFISQALNNLKLYCDSINAINNLPFGILRVRFFITKETNNLSLAIQEMQDDVTSWGKKLSIDIDKEIINLDKLSSDELKYFISQCRVDITQIINTVNNVKTSTNQTYQSVNKHIIAIKNMTPTVTAGQSAFLKELIKNMNDLSGRLTSLEPIFLGVCNAVMIVKSDIDNVDKDIALAGNIKKLAEVFFTATKNNLSMILREVS